MLVADCTFFHLVLYFLSNWLKFRGGKFCEGEPNIKWLGVLASKWSTLSLVGVSGRWLIADSTSHRKVVNESSVNAQYRVITLNARFTNLTKDSQTPPIHGLMGGLNFHSMFCLLITSIILSGFNCFSASFNSFSAPIKFEPLSDLKTFTKSLEINLRSAIVLNASVAISWASSKCTSQVVRQGNNTLYLFADAGFNRVRLENFMRTGPK